MRSPWLVLILLSIFTITLSLPTLVFADAKSDYDYQYGQYRQNYSQYTVLKQDYLDNPSLDNQQKAILAAKQAIISRELAKASLAWYLTDLINSNNAVYDPLKPFITSLEASRAFFLAQAQKSQSLITQDNLKTYTASYQNDVVVYDQSFRYGIIVNKIANLIRIQQNCQNAFNDLLPKLPTPLPTTLNARLEELKTAKTVINQKISDLTTSLDPKLGQENVDSEVFFTARIEKLNEIRTLQLDWINRLIDIDVNYVQTKN